MSLRFSWRRLLRWPARAALFFLLLVPAYALMAYVLLPASWRRPQVLSRHRPAVRVTYTAEGIPSDPLNVALVGSRTQILEAMRAAGWHAADRISLASGWRDAKSVLFDRPYPTAPMSTHYLDNRPQELAFEQAAGRSPRRRHHVRLWRFGSPGERTWLGAATYDWSVGVSHFTGEVMHHIHPDVDAERRKLICDLEQAGRVERVAEIENFRPSGFGENGGGDTFESDGMLSIVLLAQRPPAQGIRRTRALIRRVAAGES